MASTETVNNVIDITRGVIKAAQQKRKSQKPVYIAFDEYNVWYRAGGEQKLEEHYNLQDALVVASYMNTFIRNADIVKMANLAQLVNVIAPMMVTNDTFWKQTTFYPLELFATHCYGNALDTYIECDKYDAGDNKNVPYLDVSVVYNSSNAELIINAVNRHLDKAIEANISNQFGKLGNKAIVYEINSANITDENAVREQKVKTRQKEIGVKENGFVYSFPAHSYTMVRVKLNN
jgi:alpha-N-arabinofuranosidase